MENLIRVELQVLLPRHDGLRALDRKPGRPLAGHAFALADRQVSRKCGIPPGKPPGLVGRDKAIHMGGDDFVVHGHRKIDGVGKLRRRREQVAPGCHDNEIGLEYVVPVA